MNASATLWNRSVVLTILAEISFVFMGVFVKLASPNIPLFEIVFFRALTTIVIVAPIMIMKGIPFRIENRKMVTIRSFAAFISMTCNFYAIGHLALGDAYMLVMSFPIFVAILAFLFLRIRPTARLTLLILGSWAGILMILRPDLDFINFAGLVALTAALFAGIDVITVHISHQTDHALRITFYLTVLVTIVSLPFMALNFVVPSLLEGLSLLLAGAFATAAQIMIVRAYGIGNVSRLAPIAYLAVIFAYTIGLIFWEEIPHYLTFIGAVIVTVCCIQIIRMEGTSQIRGR